MTLKLSPLGGDKGSMLTHTYQHKPPIKIKVTICNHQADSSLYVWPDVWSGDLQVQKKIWSYMTPNVLTSWDQVSLNNTNQTIKKCSVGRCACTSTLQTCNWPDATTTTDQSAVYTASHRHESSTPSFNPARSKMSQNTVQGIMFTLHRSISRPRILKPCMHVVSSAK